MAEQLICNQQVDGSTPFTSSSLYGGIPERPKGADCKSVVTDFAGPNPASPTRKKHLRKQVLFSTKSAFSGGINRIYDEIPHAWDEIRLDGGWVDLISSEAVG